MHSDLSPHLHTEECRIIINKLKECHEVHNISKFWGACNDLDKLMQRCLRKEKEERRRRNAEAAIEKQKRFKSVIKQESD